MRLFTPQEMGTADAGAQRLGIPGGVLMERAGAGMARVAVERFGGSGRALAVCGGGNNGGDGFVVARELHRSGWEVSVIATKDEYSGDPQTNLEILRNLGVSVLGPESLEEEIARADLVIDALLGTGFYGEVREKEAAMIRAINSSGVPIFAVDIPSGVSGATGEVEGEAMYAGLTVCAHAAKAGCVISPGAEHAGEVTTVDIGIPREAEPEHSMVWNDAGLLRGAVPRTVGPVHKYSAGSLLVAAGARSMTGAAAMVAFGAQRTGCGIVFISAPESAAASLDAQLTEVITSPVPEDEGGRLYEGSLGAVLQGAQRASALVLGPAMGTGEGSGGLVEGILGEVEVPVLLDADAVTVLAGSDALARRQAPTIITPHAGEMGRLLGVGAKEVSARRLYYAREAAGRYGCCVLLKGSDTLVVEGERVAVNPTGTVALASAGTGDVLSGIIGALLSRGAEPFEAARAGAWAHGRAAQTWLEETGLPHESLVATDLIEYLPETIGEIEYGRA